MNLEQLVGRWHNGVVIYLSLFLARFVYNNCYNHQPNNNERASYTRIYSNSPSISLGGIWLRGLLRRWLLLLLLLLLMEMRLRMEGKMVRLRELRAVIVTAIEIRLHRKLCHRVRQREQTASERGSRTCCVGLYPKPSTPAGTPCCC